MPRHTPVLQKFVIGVDYSIRSPAISIFDADDKKFISAITTSGGKTKHRISSSHPQLSIIKYPTDWDQYEKRVFLLAKSLTEETIKHIPLNAHHSPIDVVFEGYAFAGKGKSFHLAEAAAFFKTAMISIYGIDHLRFHTIQPSTIKKFATGRGTASKKEMVESFLSEQPQIKKILLKKLKMKEDQLLTKTPIDDIADSYFVAKTFMHQ